MSADSVPITPARFAAALQDLPLSSLHLKLLELRNSIAHLDYSNEQLRPYAEGTATALSSPSSPSQPPQPQSQTGQHQPRFEPDQDCIDAIRENQEVIARMQERIRLVRAEVERRGLSWTEFQAQGEDEGDGDGGGDDSSNKDDEEEERTAAEAEADAGRTRQIGRGGDGHGHGHRLVNGDVEGESGEGDTRGVNGTRSTTTATTTAGASHTSGGSGNRDAGERHPAWTDGTFQTGVIRGGVVHMDSVAGSRRGGGGQAQGPGQGQGQGQGAGGSLTDDELRRRMEERMRDLGVDDDQDGDGGLHL